MSILVTCKRCGTSYGRVFLEGSKERRCRCGLALRLGRKRPSFVDSDALRTEDAKLRELSRDADRLSFMIVATDCPRIDVDIERAALRRRCQALFPDKMDLYDMIYESRFRRLWQQFRNG